MSHINKILPRSIRDSLDALRRLRPLAKRVCPICEYAGFFKNAGRPPRIDALCPSCHSLERHRLFWLWYLDNASRIGSPILHFAPEKTLEDCLRKIYQDNPGSYKTADLFTASDLRLDIEKIDLPSGSFMTVICNHVLEHVDDSRALPEIHRILNTNGIMIASIPIVEGWDRTYEDRTILAPADREMHFGQSDHVRYYGSDFRDRLVKYEFTIDEITAEGEDVVKYSLLRGEKLFICKKSQRTQTLHEDTNS